MYINSLSYNNGGMQKINMKFKSEVQGFQIQKSLMHNMSTLSLVIILSVAINLHFRKHKKIIIKLN